MNPNERLLRRLLVCSDVEAAIELMARDDALPEKFFDYVREHWPGYFDDEAYAETYRVAGEIEAKIDHAWFQVPTLPRFQVTLQWFRGATGIKSVLDYGCSRGIHTIHLANELPEVTWLGVDVDETSIREALKFKATRAVRPGSIDFRAGTHGSMNPSSLEGFDLVMAQEVLEHVRDPYQLLRWASDVVLPNEGLVLLTMPFGPLEYPMWVRDAGRRREHLREWREIDLKEVLVQQEDVKAQEISLGQELITGLAQGFTICCFRPSGRPFGRRNLVRLLDQVEGKELGLPR